MKIWKFAILAIFIYSGIMACPYTFGAEPLKIYSVSEEKEHEMFAPFFKKEGNLDTQFLHLTGGVLWTRVMAEAKSGKVLADLGMNTQDFSLAAKQAGLLVPYRSKIWASNNVPEIFKDPDGCWYGWAYWTAVITVNTDLLKKKGLSSPRSWNDILDSKWKGEIVMPNPGTSGTAYMMVSTIFQLMGEEKGWDYLGKLDKNVAQYTKSGSAPADLVARSEYVLGITWDMAPFEKKEAGYPIEIIAPEEGTGFQLDTVSIFKDTDKMEDAKKFVDLMGTKKFMELAGNRRSKVTMSGVKSRISFEPKLIKYDASWAAANKGRIMKAWKEKFSK